MNRYFVVSLSILVLVVALIYSLTGDEKDKSMAAVKATLTVEHDGPGGWKLRFKSVNIPPTVFLCYTRTPSGSFSVSLNAAGESYFAEHKDDVNAAIAAAVAQAVSEITDNSGTICLNQCLEVGSGARGSTVGLASATAQILLLNGGPTSVPLCYPTEEDQAASQPAVGITVKVTAPGVTGWDLSGFIAGVTPTDSESGSPNTTQYLADFLAAMPDAICTGSGGVWTSREFLFNNVSYGPMKGSLRVEQPPMYNGISIEFRAFPQDPESIVTAPYIAALYDLNGNPSSNTGTLSATYVDGILGGPLTFPAGFNMTYQDGSTPRTLGSDGQVVPFDSEGGEDPSFEVGDDTASLTGSGTMSVTFEDADPIVTDPGFTSKCQHDYTYTNVDKAQRLCLNEMQLQTKGVPYIFPRGKPPRCKIQLFAT